MDVGCLPLRVFPVLFQLRHMKVVVKSRQTVAPSGEQLRTYQDCYFIDNLKVGHELVQLA